MHQLAAVVLFALSVVSSTATSVTYSGNSSTTAFATGFKFISASDLVVTKTTSGVTTTLVLGVGYTVTGADSSSGGTVTCTSAPATGSTLKITRATPVTQTLALQHQGPLPVQSLQDAFDKSIMVSQEANAAATSLTSRVGTLETEEADHESRIATLESYNISSRLTLLESDVSTLLTASGFDLGAIYAAAHSWTAQQTFSTSTSSSAINATSSSTGSGIVASNSSSGKAIHITAGGQTIDLGGLLISAGGLTVTGATTLNSGLAVATTGNSTAIAGTGHGLGAGALFVGGASGGAGIISQGGASDGPGGTFSGGGTNGPGAIFTGAGTGEGGSFTGGDTNGIGVVSTGSGTGGGGSFTGGSSGGYALTATPGSGQSVGLYTTGDIKLAGGDPASTTGLKNQLTSANIIKAWANITRGASPAINGGFNVAGASCASNQITVTFATSPSGAMADANYSVSAVSVGAFAAMWIAQQTTTAVKLAALDSAGATLDLCTTSNVVDVTVVGLQ